MRAVPPSPTASSQLGLLNQGSVCPLPPHSPHIALSRHLGMPGPGGQGQTFPWLSLKAQGFPRGVVTVRASGGHLAQCPTRAGQSTSGPVVPAATAATSSAVSPSWEQLVFPGKLPNGSTMQGLWRQSSKGRGLVPSAGPTGHNTCRTAEP